MMLNCTRSLITTLFLGLVLLCRGRWGPVNGTILAGKHRKWYSGYLPNPLP